MGAAISALAVLLIAGLTALFWRPAPPGKIIMITGPQGSAYDGYGKRYKELLARSGVEVALQSSSGGIETLERLRNAKDDVTVGFIASGLAEPDETGRLVSLGSVAYEALWIFHRSALKLERIGDFQGLKVAAGAEGTDTRRMAMRLLGLNGVDASTQHLAGLNGLAAADALERGEVDVAFLMATAESAAVNRLLREPGVSLMDIRRADAYAKRFPSLVKVDVPEGAADLQLDIPARATTLLAVRSNLVATEDVHPVLVDLLLDAAREVHGGSGLIRNAGEFPSGIVSDFTLSPEAARYFKAGPSPLQSYLPYWAVVWLHRIVFFGLPAFVVIFPLLRFTPVVYRWSMRRKIYRWYGELFFIEWALESDEVERGALQERLHALEQKINAVRVPLSFAGEAYQLRAHVDMVRKARPLADTLVPSQREPTAAAGSGARRRRS